MLPTGRFGDELKKNGFDFYAGVPCSFLKDLINYAVNSCDYVAAVNEGDAVAISAGAYLGGKRPVVLMQNSGLTNAVSPLTSLNAIFKIPVLGFVSLRGAEGIPDEPQHALMGGITTGMLDLMRIPWEYLSTDMTEAQKQIGRACRAVEHNQTFFFVVRKDTFEKVPLTKRPARIKQQGIRTARTRNDALPKRIEALQTIVDHGDGKTVLLATTGYTGRELYTVRDADTHLYMVGSMGCVGPLGLGLSMARPDKNVIAIDGDGALLMRMGSLAVDAYYRPANMLRLLLDNNAYESTGGQSTVSENVDFVSVAASMGYPHARYLHDLDELADCIREWRKNKGLTFAYMKIYPGTPKDLLRPAIGPEEVKIRLMRALHEYVA